MVYATLFHEAKGHMAGEPLRRQTKRARKGSNKTTDELRRKMFEDFEASIVAQTARINERLAQVGNRLRHANRHTLDNGPLTLEGGSALAYKGDDVDVRHKR